ncbi:MAG: PH domain-containing protein [Lachnospiraceae bacterium]
MEFRERKRIAFFALPFTFTVYTVKEDMITIDAGFLNKTENDCYMYKIQDATLTTSLLERIFGIGTIKCFTGDVTNQRLDLIHIKNAKAIKDFIVTYSELERRKKRTLNTLDIGAEAIDDIDVAQAIDTLTDLGDEIK